MCSLIARGHQRCNVKDTRCRLSCWHPTKIPVCVADAPVLIQLLVSVPGEAAEGGANVESLLLTS